VLARNEHDGLGESLRTKAACHSSNLISAALASSAGSNA
jgi:hypothetical protein